MKNNKGITMIALVITVIVLLILSAIALTTLSGDNGILNKSKNAAQETQKANSKESLELALEEASIEKIQNTQFNKDDFLDNIIKSQVDNCNIIGDKVTINGYQFTIDRDNLKITGIENINMPNDTSSNPNIAKASVIVDNANKLKQFTDQINSGDSFDGKIVVLTSDIDMSTVCSSTLGNWNPIGSSTTNFSGTFDGDGHTISNLYINTTNSTIGLFGVTSSSAIIENLRLSNSNVSGNGQVGMICGANSGLIEKCINENGIIDGKNAGVGGIAGANIGGIIRKSYNSSNINSTYYEIGGIVGYNYGIVEECYNSGNITNSNVTIGGIAGGNYDTIMNCYNKGKIQSTGSDTFGGIAGYVSTNSYSAVNLPKAIIRNSYNIGNIVTTGTWGKGAIAGNAGNLAAINNYWLNTCGASYGNSGSSSNNTGSVSKSDTELKALSAGLGSAYTQDFEGINNGYPILKWQAEN